MADHRDLLLNSGVLVDFEVTPNGWKIQKGAAIGAAVGALIEQFPVKRVMAERGRLAASILMPEDALSPDGVSFMRDRLKRCVEDAIKAIT